MSITLEEIQAEQDMSNSLSRRQLGVAEMWRTLVANNRPEPFYKSFHFDVTGDDLTNVVSEHDQLIKELGITFQWTGDESLRQEQQVVLQENGFALTAIAYATKSGEFASIWYFGEDSRFTLPTTFYQVAGV